MEGQIDDNRKKTTIMVFIMITAIGELVIEISMIITVSKIIEHFIQKQSWLKFVNTI